VTPVVEGYRPAKNARTAGRVVDGKALIVVVDQRELHTLNAVATRIWELCDGRSVGEIADAISAEFEVDRESALRDAVQFVGELQRIGALEDVSDGVRT
jgi:pyrroloquinoline quinone biosynthesis protein D